MVVGTTVFRTDEVPKADRFGLWCEQLSHLTAPMTMTSDHAADFQAQARIVQLGSRRMCSTTMQSLRCQRTPRLVRQSAPEMYHLSLLRDGLIGVRQAGEQALHRRNDLCLVDMSRPFDSELIGDRPIEAIGIEIPKSLLPLPESKMERLLARRLPGEHGLGALVMGFATRLSAEADTYRPGDGPRLGAVLVDLVSALLAHTLDAERALPAETHRRALTLRIRAFVQQHLQDPDLTAGSVAAAHHISVSYLHRLFETEEVTVAAWIRQQRLERTRRDLADPALLHTPIHQIAGRWGFTDAAGFSRVFRSAYGMPPRDFRSRHGQPPGQR
ncbi:helix-turn-helix domain-containing protein [Micromonospora sp. NPDC050397]|uniref:AraC-like ligand-binding domain-containing protein n=1 Tax=Micromonospora sp. NPDC050397 TaxID=3364279 RepID=UPI00384C7D2F